MSRRASPGCRSASPTRPNSAQQLIGGSQLRTLPGQTGAGGPGRSVSDNWSFAANYTFAIDQFKVGASVGYTRGNGLGRAGGAATDKDPRMAGGGVRVDYGPFRVNAGYKSVWGLENGNGNANGTDTRNTATAGFSNQGHMWMAGALYRWGPNGVSLGWQKGYEQGMIGARATSLTLMNASYSRTLAPGIKADANVAYGNFDGQDRAGQVGHVGWAFVTAFRLDF